MLIMPACFPCTVGCTCLTYLITDRLTRGSSNEDLPPPIEGGSGLSVIPLFGSTTLHKAKSQLLLRRYQWTKGIPIYPQRC
ncbi:hypothetical protein GYMLUDRAFT_42399 [Collybiopsis luxurians FD-317 M1]|uniref:Uncharacterized protein n=1 Tax=Collybiopsis luxurians FD-317 M1 TaxID=944289 RepID=A0A0D0CRV9_9AGAR|nr:hypothetical protein GYMLUDRAFT_42399 [Collybiopsis luxurians FD-317 M1]